MDTEICITLFMLKYFKVDYRHNNYHAISWPVGNSPRWSFSKSKNEVQMNTFSLEDGLSKCIPFRVSESICLRGKMLNIYECTCI